MLAQQIGQRRKAAALCSAEACKNRGHIFAGDHIGKAVVPRKGIHLAHCPHKVTFKAECSLSAFGTAAVFSRVIVIFI